MADTSLFGNPGIQSSVQPILGPQQPIINGYNIPAPSTSIIPGMTAPQYMSFSQNQQSKQVFDIKSEIQQSLQSDEGQNAIKSLMDDFPQMKQYLNNQGVK